MLKRNGALLLVGLAAAGAGSWFAASHYAPQTSSGEAVAELWGLAFPDLGGRAQPLSQWRGRVVVLNFWASWCAPCREEMPDFVAVRNQFHSEGVEFVGLAIDQPKPVAQFLQQVPVSYPILIGGSSAHSLARQLGNASGALPYTVVLDHDGTVLLQHLGRLPRATLEKVLREKGV